MQPLQYSDIAVGALVTPTPASFTILSDGTRMIHGLVYVITDENRWLIASNLAAFLLVQRAQTT